MHRCFLPLLFAFTVVSLVSAQSPDALFDRNWYLQSIEWVGSHTELPVRDHVPRLKFPRPPRVDCSDSGWFGIDAIDGCNRNNGGFKVCGSDSIEISFGSMTRLGCSDGSNDFADVYIEELFAVRKYDVTDSTLCMWSADSMVILRYGRLARYEVGLRVQLVNLIEGYSGFELIANDTSQVVVRVDSFARTSRCPRLAGHTGTLAIRARGASYAARAFDTTLTAADTGSIVFVMYDDGSGNPRVMVMPRLRAVFGPTTKVRVAHASGRMVSLMVRVEAEGPQLVLEDQALVEGSTTVTREISRSSLRLFMSRTGSDEIFRFSTTETESNAASTLVITGSPERGDLAAWVLRDELIQFASPVKAMTRGGTGRAHRIVNMTGTSELTMSTPHIAPQRVPATTASIVDDDLDNRDLVVVDFPSGASDTISHVANPGILITSIAIGENAYRHVSTRLAGPSSRDSVALALVMIGPVAGEKVRVNGDRRRMFLGPDALSYSTTAGRCTLAVYVERPGRTDSLVAAFLGDFVGGRSYTIVFDKRDARFAARVVDNSNRAAQSNLPLLPRIAIPPDEQPRTGSLSVINVTNVSVSSSAFGNTSSDLVEAHRSREIPTMTPAKYVNVIVIENDDRYQLTHTIAPDTATLVFVIGGAWSQPYSLVELTSPKLRTEFDSTPRLRVVNALADIDAVDVVSSDLVGGQRERIRRHDAGIQHTSLRPIVRVGVTNITGYQLFTFSDTLQMRHSYTAILTGTVADPLVYMYDESIADQALKELSVSPPVVAGITSTSHQARLRPNPASRDIVIAVDRSDVDEILLIDALGAVRDVRSVSGSSVMLDLQGMPTGVYTVIARGHRRVIWRESVVVAH